MHLVYQAAQKSSNIQIGRFNINPEDGTAFKNFNLDNTIIGNGDNQLMGVGTTKTDIIFNAGWSGIAACDCDRCNRQGAPVNVFRLSAQTGENIFNISVNGVNGIIEVPAGSYVGQPRRSPRNTD